uniref:EFHB C-terminal EF-hand domain-containing protein n=2 Tax=Schistosoma mansoni TaxID=6183 RepID=A0A5K4EQ50_SCHMA
MHTNCDPRGIHVRRAMDWTFNDSNNQHTTIMNKTQIDYKTKHDDILGKVRDPIRDTMKIPDDHIFGLFNKTNDTTVGQLLHGLLPRNIFGLYTDNSSIHKQNEFNKKNCIQYSDRFKLMMSVIHHALRKAHYTHGPEIIAILSQLANKSNLIPMIDARRIFNHFQVPLDEELTEHLFDLITVPASNEMIKHVKECIKQNKENDINNEKHYHIENDVINWAVDWCKLSELLNWNNDKFMRSCCSGFTTIASNSTSSVVQPEYYEDTENVRSRLQRAIQANIHHWTTTNSTYTGNLNGLINTHNWEILGEKSLQLDKLVPKFRRSTDHTHYGDEAGVGSIMSPSIFTDYGLNNRDLLTLRNKQDILDLFTQANFCYLFNAPLSFDKVWQMALSLDKTLLGNKQPTTDEQVTLQSFKDALFKLHKDSDQQEDRS